MQRRATADSGNLVARVRKHPLWDQALSLWSGSTDSKTLNYQRTNPREYEIVRTHTTETTWIQNAASSNHRVQDASSKQQTKQKYRPNHQQMGLPSPCQPKEKQTSKQKCSTNLTLYEAYTNHWTNLRRADQKEERIQPSSRKEFNFPWSLGKGHL